MIGKLTLAAAFGAGYVLGAKAGQDRYDQIVKTAQNVANKPAVKDATDKATAKATEVGELAKDKATATAGDAVETVKGKVNGEDPVDTVDLNTYAPNRAGAAASDTA